MPTAVDLVGADTVAKLEQAGYVLVARQDFDPLTAPAVICRWCRDLVRTGRMPVNDGICGDCARRLQSRLGCATDGLNVTKSADALAGQPAKEAN